jgi:hypothetical protein
MGKFPNEVDNISTKNVSAVQEVNKRFCNLPSAGDNRDSAYHIFSNKKNKKSKRGTKSSVSSSSKPSLSSSSKDAASSSKAKTYTWYTKYHLSKANGHGWHGAPSLRSLTTRSLSLRENGKCRILLDITWIPILRSRASFTRILK